MVSKVMVIEHMTHKTGKFVFSSEYDSQIITPKFVEASILYSTVSELPILPHLAAELKEDLIRRSIFGTAAIEGNELTEEEVDVVLNKDKTAELASRAEQEIDNLKRLYSLFKGKKDDSVWGVREKFIKDVHKLLTSRIDYHHNSPGKYRNEPVYVGNAEHGGKYTPPKTLDDIRTLMKMFTEWINSREMKEEASMIRACLAHFHLAKIHPFQDGNGRTARYIEAMILDRAGIKYLPEMMSNYYYKNIDDYFIAFSQTHKTKSRSDVTPFLSFYFDGIIDSLKEIKNKITFYIRMMSLKNLYYYQKREKALTLRQRDLLLVCLETGLSFTMADLFSQPVLRPLYTNVSESTARRDLKKLYDGRYLVFNKDTNKYRVNLHMLG